VPKNAFQIGFFNAFFLACPISFAFLVNIRRYWLQGFEYGLMGILGHRFGEVTLLIRMANGFSFLWYTNGSRARLIVSLGIIFYFLKESFQVQVTTTFNSVQTQELNLRKDRKVFFSKRMIFFLHMIYRWSEQRVFFRTFGNQTLDTSNFNSVISYFSIQHIICLSYIAGLLLGGLFFDFLLAARLFKGIEYFFLNTGLPPSEWKQKIHTWTTRLIVACIIRRVPFYRADNLVFSSLGFFGRDTELRRQVSRNAFSYSIDRDKPSISSLFEGRYILGEDSYGRSAPDIIHEPWFLNRLAVEATRDLVDETYRTQFSSQRVDIVYLGALERKISEWLGLLNQNNSTFFDDEQKPVKNKLDKKRVDEIFVKEQVRKGLSSNVIGITFRVNSQMKKRPLADIELIITRFNRWSRATYKTITIDTVDQLLKVPSGLFALYRSCSPISPSYLASIGKLEPDKIIRYSKSTEFYRKRNARQSILHRGPIIIYIDLFRKTRSASKGFSREISTRQQQNDLYRARLVMHNYVSSLRKYSESSRDLFNIKHSSKLFNLMRQRITWQQQILRNIFGGSRSRRNSVYSQQYVGNLQLVRRLFAISWSVHEQIIPSRLQIKEKIIRRRKMALDQRTFDKQKNIFEHEEIGKVVPWKIQNNQERKQILNMSEIKSKNLYGWRWLSKKRYFPDFRVERKPLYAGWDNQRHAFILCNRYLPTEWSIRTKVARNTKLNMFSFYFTNLEKYYKEKHRVEFTVWPKNPQTRRLHLSSIRYNVRTLLKRRPVYRGNDIFVLSQDLSYWRRKITRDSNTYTNYRWLDPQSNRRHPIRSRQRLPLSLERGFNNNIVGRVQPSARGGLVWPGNNSFIFIPEKFYRPGYKKTE
jgi:hypothetical protein